MQKHVLDRSASTLKAKAEDAAIDNVFAVNLGGGIGDSSLISIMAGDYSR